MSDTLNVPIHSGTMLKRQRLKLLVIIGGLLSLYLLGAYSGILEGKPLSWWSDFFWTFAALATGMRCLHTAKNRTMAHERKAWIFFGFAALSWFVGMLIWDYYEVFGDELVPFPSIGDWFFIGYAVLFLTGLIYYRTQMPARQYNMIQVANLGLIVCTIIVLCFILLSQALQQSQNTLDYELFALLHAIFTIACLVFGLYCYWFYIWQENQRSFRLMLAALAIFAITDTLYAFQLLGQSFNASSFLNVYWLVALAFQYLAAFEQDTITHKPFQNIKSNSTPRAQKYEAIMPALCLFSVLFFALYFKDQLNETIFNVMSISAIAFAFFLTLREWYSNSLETALMDEIQMANTKLEQRVRQRTAELSTANLELEAFCYSVSHDLRAPLRSIDGFSEILLEDYQDNIDKVGKDYLHRVRSGATKMGQLIDALLGLSRVSRQSIQHTQINLSNIVRDIIQQLREKEPERQINILIEENVFAIGDEQLLKIVLENLLNNAWKYTAKKEKPTIEFGSSEVNGETIYFIKDNGAGFNMKYVSKLFDPFQRLHGDEFEGTGIGLATVQRCIRRHNGRIWAAAEMDSGATFFFTIPPI